MGAEPLSGVTALVTGGGSGLGLACARRLRDDGAAVTIVGRTEDRLREVRAPCSRPPTPTRSVFDPSGGAMEEIRAAGGDLKTLIHMDGAEHRAYRKVTNDWFKPGNLRQQVGLRVEDLARMELRAFFRELLPRLESIELEREPEYTASTFVGGPKRMPVRYRIRAAA